LEKKKAFIVNILFYGLLILLGWAVCKYILPVLIPFIIAFVIATVLHAGVRRICKKEGRMKRMISLLFVAGFYAVFFTVIAIAGVKIVEAVSGLLMAAPEFYTEEIVPALTNLVGTVEQWFASIDPHVAEQIVDVSLKVVTNLGSSITNFSVKAVGIISGSIAGIPGFVIRFIVMIISTFFFMLDYEKVRALFRRLVPEGKLGLVRDIKSYLKNSLLIYLKSYTLLCVLTFVELSIGFTILKVPYAVLIGLAVALFDILPILGVGGILMPWGVISFVLGNIPMGIGMFVLYFIITAIRNTLEPKLVGKQIGLHPLATLISMYLGLKLIGIWGMFLFPVTLTVVIGMRREKRGEESAVDRGQAMDGLIK